MLRASKRGLCQMDGVEETKNNYWPDYVLSPPANHRQEGLSKPLAYSASFQASCYFPPAKSNRKPIIVSATEEGVKQNQKK